jgi:cation diffusion facilitator family transporter
LVLAVLKTVVGVIGNSSGLIADGAHSATDAVSSIILYIGLKFSDRPADEEHPYGHRNIEFIIAKVVSIFLLVVGLFILASAIYKLTKGHIVTPDFVTFAVAVFSVVANIIMYRYGNCVGTQMNSPAVLSVAYEIKADAMSSIAIAIGILFAEFGYPFLDPVAACVVSLLIIKNSIHMLMGAMDGLMDASIDTKTKRKITTLIERHPEVLGIDFLRTRLLGRDISVEAGIKVEASKTVEEGNDIIREIKSDLVNMVDNLKNVEICTIAVGDEGTEISDDVGPVFDAI